MNILLTSVGRRSYLVKYFRDALNGDGLVHAANSQYSPALQFADRTIITPLIYNDDYIDFLLEYSMNNSISAITPSFDIDLPVLAKAKNIFKEHGVHVLVSDQEVTQICNDKWRSYAYFKENGLNTPKTYLLVDDALHAISKKEVKYPVIIKPRWGMGSIGMFTAENDAELTIFYERSKHEIMNTYLKYESGSDMDHSVLIQEMLIGPEYGLDVVNDLNKQYITTLVKRKIAKRSGETYSAKTEDNPLLRELGKRISHNLKHIAILDVDCIIVEDIPYVLEMNCRFSGMYPFSHIAGADLPLAIIQWLKGETPRRELFEVKYGVAGIKDMAPMIIK